MFLNLELILILSKLFNTLYRMWQKNLHNFGSQYKQNNTKIKFLQDQIIYNIAHILYNLKIKSQSVFFIINTHFKAFPEEMTIHS